MNALLHITDAPIVFDQVVNKRSVLAHLMHYTTAFSVY